jgi:dTDP-glucose 4,6-dehydratase
LKKPESLIRFVKDRPGHDRRYALDSSKLSNELGWKPLVSLTEGIPRTVRWYCEHQDWLRKVKSGEYQEYYRRHYHERHGLQE